jgi:amino acid permease
MLQPGENTPKYNSVANSKVTNDSDGGGRAASKRHQGVYHNNTNGGVLVLLYPELAYRAFGVTGKRYVMTGIALMQFGVCLTYLIFVQQNLHITFLTQWFGSNNPYVSPQFSLDVMVLVEIPLSWIRDISLLTPTNMLANALISYGLLVCLAFALSIMLQPEHDMSLSTTQLTHIPPLQDQWYLFIGTSVHTNIPYTYMLCSVSSLPPMHHVFDSFTFSFLVILVICMTIGLTF